MSLIKWEQREFWKKHKLETSTWILQNINDGISNFDEGRIELVVFGCSFYYTMSLLSRDKYEQEK